MIIIDGKPFSIENSEKEWASIKQRLFAEFPSADEGIDVARMKNFLAAQGLRTPDILFVLQKNKEHIRALIKSLLPEEDWDSTGMYIKRLDLALVERREDWESTNGPFYSELIGIHELAHGTDAAREHSIFRDTGFNLRHDFARMGFVDVRQDEGGFPEEGFADYLRGEYAALYMPQVLRNSIFKVYSQSPEFITEKSGAVVRVASKFYCKSLNAIQHSGSAYAGSAMDMLVKSIPNLKAVLLETRNNIKSISKVEALINTIRPGLYRELLGLKYDPRDDYADFKKGNALVTSLLAEFQ